MMEVNLRAVEQEDLPIFYEHQRDPQANAMAAFPAREHDAFDAHWAKILADPQNILFTILADGKVAGSVSSFIMEGEREVGYWLGRKFWGQGIATQALRLFLDELKERPLVAHAARHNIGSQRVLEKCGFERVGTIEENVTELGRFMLSKP
jgi:RimJ/RimL family protein N-acetyltransferase